MDHLLAHQAAAPARRDPHRGVAVGAGFAALFRSDLRDDGRWPGRFVGADGDLYVPDRVQFFPAGLRQHDRFRDVHHRVAGCRDRIAHDASLRNGSLSMATETNRLHFPRIRIGVPLLGLIWLAVTTLPFIFVVVTSLKTQEETFSEPVWALPNHVYFGNYLAVLRGPYLTYF